MPPRRKRYSHTSPSRLSPQPLQPSTREWPEHGACIVCPCGCGQPRHRGATGTTSLSHSQPHHNGNHAISHEKRNLYEKLQISVLWVFVAFISNLKLVLVKKPTTGFQTKKLKRCSSNKHAHNSVLNRGRYIWQLSSSTIKNVTIVAVVTCRSSWGPLYPATLVSSSWDVTISFSIYQDRVSF